MIPARTEDVTERTFYVVKRDGGPKLGTSWGLYDEHMEPMRCNRLSLDESGHVLAFSYGTMTETDLGPGRIIELPAVRSRTP